MENETMNPDERRSSLWAELEEKAKDDPELAEHLEAARRVMKRYEETLRRLADS